MTTIHATYQLRGYCTKAGHARIKRALADLCTLYNAALQERRDAWHMAGRSVSLYDQMRSLTLIRKDDPVWRELGIAVARGPLVRANRAFQAFFRRVKSGDKPGFPRFKPRRRYRCIELSEVRSSMVKISPDGRKAYIRIKGLPVIELRFQRPLPDSEQLRSLRIVDRPNGLTVDLVYEAEKEPLPPTSSTVGIDLGVNQRLTLSDGNTVEPQQLDRRRERRLHRDVSRCRKGSNTRRKRVATLSKETRRNAVRNRNQCHTVTTDLVQQHGHIAVEKLRIPNMTASAAGTVEEPGIQVAQKRGLNRSILEQSWGTILQQLRYKAAWAGRELFEVDPRYTSKTCSRCGAIAEGPPAIYRIFQCCACDYEADRDLNAALNIEYRAFGPHRGGNSPGVAQSTVGGMLPEPQRA